MSAPHDGPVVNPIVGQALPERPRRAPAPAWVRADWPLAAALAALVTVTVVAVCVAYGLALGALAAGGEGLVPGAIAGALLPFAAVGGEVSVFSGTRQDSVILLLDQAPLVLTALAAGVTWLALRGGVARLAGERPRARALVAKVALLVAAVVLVAGGFTDAGGVDTFAAGTERKTLAGVAQGTASFGALMLVAAVGAVLLVRARVPVTPPLPLNLRRALLAARAGAAAYVVVGLVSGLAGLLVLAGHADGGRERLAVVASAPLTLSGFATTGSAVAHGGAAGSTDVERGLAMSVEEIDLDVNDPRGFGLDRIDPDDLMDCERRSSTADEERDCIQALLRDLAQARAEDDTDPDVAYRDALRLSSVAQTGAERVSLSDWELQLTDESGRAPWWAFLSLLLPLAGLVGGTLLLLRRANPPTEGWALRLGVVLGFGYAITCAVVAGASPQAFVGMGSRLDSADFGLLLVPALGSSLGLPVLWGLLVPGLTAVVWARRRGLPGNVLAGLGALPDRVPGGPDHLVCPGCAGAVLAGDAFCARCGRSLR